MTNDLKEIQGHYYLNSLPDLGDFVAVVVSFASTVAIMVLVWQALMLLSRKPRQKRWQVLCGVIIACGLTYTVLYMFDVPGVLAVVSNSGGDVPILSSIRTATLVGLLFTLSRIMNGATRAEAWRAAD